MPVDSKMEKLWYVHMMEYYSAVRMDFVQLPITTNDVAMIILSERS